MHDYRDTLRAELERRCNQNPRYSLRAFARDLGLAPSRLSEVLNGRRGLGEAAAAQVVRRLRLGPGARERFSASVAAQHARSAAKRQQGQSRLEELAAGEREQLRHDPRAYIVAWYYGAVAELLRCPGAPADPAALARRLGLSEFQVRQALRYLERTGYAERQDGRLRRGERDALELRLSQEQVLARASQVLALAGEEGPEDAGGSGGSGGSDFLAVHLALDAAGAAEARRLTHRFVRQLARLAAAVPQPDRVETLAVQRFRADVPEKSPQRPIKQKEDKP